MNVETWLISLLIFNIVVTLLVLFIAYHNRRLFQIARPEGSSTHPGDKKIFQHYRDTLITDLGQHIQKLPKEHLNLALFYIDLDNFKQVNEALGYDLGDLFLQQVQEAFEKMDWPNKSLHRLGGDDFVLILPAFETEKKVSDLVEEIVSVLKKGFTLENHELTISASIGISIYPRDGLDAKTLLKCANVAMYQAKYQGRNTFAFYNPEMDRKALKRQALESYLRKALERDELLVYYQPKVNIQTTQIVGAEALIRWLHPELGMISPLEFISLAEQTGLVIPLGGWILRTACKQAQEWHQQGYGNFTIAVNLSPYQFKQGDIGGLIAQVLWETGLDPASLELEITETLLMENPEKSLLMLRVLRTMGVQVAIDDFGTGYSSLSQLKNLPFQSLKIDQSFIRNLEIEPESRAIVSTIISMAKQLRLRVIAEGVETEEQQAFLIQEGCDYAQGYLFGKPMTVQQFEELMRKQQ